MLKDELAYSVNHVYREGYDAGFLDGRETAVWENGITGVPTLHEDTDDDGHYLISDPVLGYDPNEKVFAVVVCEIDEYGVRHWSDYNSAETFMITRWWPLPEVLT